VALRLGADKPLTRPFETFPVSPGKDKLVSIVFFKIYNDRKTTTPPSSPTSPPTSPSSDKISPCILCVLRVSVVDTLSI